MVIVGIEEDKMAGEVRVHELKGEGCSPELQRTLSTSLCRGSSRRSG